jgi:diacylglycerol kinase
MLEEHHPRHHYNSLKHAWRGFYASLLNPTSRNLRFEVALGAIALIFAYYFQFDIARQMIVIATVLLVLGFELLNTSIEDVVDLLHPEKHPIAKAAKDASAAAVLAICLLATVVGVYLYLPPFLTLFGY